MQKEEPTQAHITNPALALAFAFCCQSCIGSTMLMMDSGDGELPWRKLINYSFSPHRSSTTTYNNDDDVLPIPFDTCGRNRSC